MVGKVNKKALGAIDADAISMLTYRNSATLSERQELKVNILVNR